MKCSKCGVDNPDGSQLCVACNNPLIPNIPQQQGVGIKTSGLAITSLVLGILTPFTCGITFLPAIICGIIALVLIGKSKGQLKGIGFAVAGIAVPVAVLPTIALLMGILMPALAEVRTMAHRVLCATNLQGLSKAMIIYANDNDGKYPTGSQWCDLLIEYADVSPKQFICPGATEGPSNYAINKNAEKLGTSAPYDMVLVFESVPGWNLSGGPELLTLENHKGDGCNVIFADGHIEFIRAEDIDNLRWTEKDNP